MVVVGQRSLPDRHTDWWSIWIYIGTESIRLYHCSMKTPPATPEFATFTNAVRDILKISKTEMQERMETHRETGKRLSKGASLDSVVASRLRDSVR